MWRSARRRFACRIWSGAAGILKFAFQAQFLDDDTSQELAAGVISRGGTTSSEMSYSDFESLVDEYSPRTACRLYNAGRPEAQQINCFDDATLKGSWSN